MHRFVFLIAAIKSLVIAVESPDKLGERRHEAASARLSPAFIFNAESLATGSVVCAIMTRNNLEVFRMEV